MGNVGGNNPVWLVKPDYVHLLTEKFDDDAFADLLIADIYGEAGCEQFNGNDAVVSERNCNFSGGEDQGSELEESDNELLGDKAAGSLQCRARSK